MSHASLTARYRPQTFGQAAGQEVIKAILSRAALEDRIAPACAAGWVVVPQQVDAPVIGRASGMWGRGSSRRRAGVRRGLWCQLRSKLPQRLSGSLAQALAHGVTISACLNHVGHVIAIRQHARLFHWQHVAGAAVLVQLAAWPLAMASA